MPSLHYAPLTGAALKEYYVRQAETEDTCTYTDKSSKREEDGYLSDTILDQVFSCDAYTPRSSETPLVDHHTVLLPSSLDNRKRQNETSMPYEDEQFDTIVSNDGVDSSRIGTVFENTLQNHKRFKSNHAYHQQGGEQQERGRSHPTAPPTAQYSTMILLSPSLMSNSGNSNYDGKNGQDTTSVHDSSFLSDEDEAICCTNDTTLSVPLTEGKQGCEIKQKKLVGKRCSFEERFEQLEAYKAKHGHCNVKATSGDDKSLGRWCSKVKQSVKKMKSNEAPIVAGFSEDSLQRLEDIGFDCNPKKEYCSFEKRFEQLEAYKAKHGHCNVKMKSGNDKSLGRWCSHVRQSVKKMKNNEAPSIVVGLSKENIQRLEDIGFDCNPKRECCSFEECFEQLEAYKAKHGHCNVKTKSGNDESLGRWCSHVRQSVKKMKNNEAPIVAGLSEENLQRLEDIGFDCNINCSFEERFEQLEAYKAKHGHCNVKTKSGDDKSLGRWCSHVRQSVKKMKNNEAPNLVGLSEENIQRLEDIGFARLRSWI